MENKLAKKGFLLGKNTSLEGHNLRVSGTRRGLDVIIPLKNVLNNVGVTEGIEFPSVRSFIPMRKHLRGEFIVAKCGLGPKFILSPDGPHVMISDSFARGKGGFFWAIDHHNSIPGLMEVKNLFGNQWFSPWHDGTGIDTIVITREDAQKIQAAERRRSAECRGGCVHWLPKVQECSIGETF